MLENRYTMTYCNMSANGFSAAFTTNPPRLVWAGRLLIETRLSFWIYDTFGWKGC